MFCVATSVVHIPVTHFQNMCLEMPSQINQIVVPAVEEDNLWLDDEQ